MTWVTPPGYRVYPPKLNITEEVLDNQIAAGNGSTPAIIWNGGTWTYEELNRQVCRMAAGLRGLGIANGDIVLFRCRNVPLACAAILATYKIGAISALTSTLLREAELETILESTEPKAVVTLHEVAEPVRNITRKHGIAKILLLAGQPTGSNEISVQQFVDVPVGMPTAETSALDPAVLFYSSGTTGKPKGVLHAHRWIAAMGDVIRLQMEYSRGDVAMTPGEFSFMATWGHCFVVPLYSGATVGLYSDRPNPRAVLQAIAAHRVSKFMAVPTFYRTVLANEGVEDGIDLSAVRIWVSGGEALSETTVVNWQKRFATPLHDMYGITEMQVVIANSPANPHKPGSVGRLLPGIRITLRDDELNEVPVGNPGRIMVHRDDPGMFLCYYKDREKWRAAHRGDYYDTGDVMRRDQDGYFWYLGRQDDLFKSRGMFVSPSEVEAALLHHSAVAEAAVIGVPDERTGNRVVAFAVPANGFEPSAGLAADILSVAAIHLAAYKVPERLEFVDALPKSVVGKILRRALRERT
jgi:acyl-coenzyme A synthetase/AMP-(fatty) acid ligase